VGEAASYSQYQELKACTFKPEINREVPKTQVRGGDGGAGAGWGQGHGGSWCCLVRLPCPPFLVVASSCALCCVCVDQGHMCGCVCLSNCTAVSCLPHPRVLS
jgi:hypothetical protein